MGLDMYLTAERYVSDYSERDEVIKRALADLPGLNKKFGRVKYLTTDVMYWRKANAIHQWFVKNCQDGVDECQKTALDLKNLKELLETCKAVLDDKQKCHDLLPVQAGFFFGSTEYDEWYFKDIEMTVDKLEDLFSVSEDELHLYYFYYQSSW